jgi:replicative DNA helicase
MSARNEAEVINAVCKNKDFHVLLEDNAGPLFSTYKDVYDHLLVTYQVTKTVPQAAMLANDFSYFELIPDEELSATKYHLDRLRETYTEEKLHLILRDGASKLQKSGAHTAISSLESNLARLNQTSVVIHDIDVTDVDTTVRHFEHVKSLYDEHGDLGIKTGINEFDFCLPMGIAPGQYGIFMAFPAVGKSWMAQYMAVQAWKKGRRPMIISVEMTESEVRNRLLAIIGDGKWSHRKLSSGDVDINDYKEWAEGEFKDKQDFIIVSNEGLNSVTPSVIRAKIEQHKPDVVFIDYLQLMDDGVSGSGKTESLMNISRELKMMAVSMKIPVIAIVSATPEKDQLSMEEPPELAQVGWSRQVTYDADWVVSMGREKNSDILQVVFRKNRNGILGDFEMQIDFDKGIWRSVGF